MDILGIVSALAPDHALHGAHEQVEGIGPDIEVKCQCSARLTFLATEIAKLEPVVKSPTIEHQHGHRSKVSK